jgi:1-acyl-sn-glycerol-3-phosphate acyltransferase
MVPKSALAQRPAYQPREFPTDWARTPPARAARAVLQNGGLRPLLWSQTKPIVHGVELLEGLKGPVLYVSNHSSHLDAPLILGALPAARRDQVAVTAAADYFFDSAWKAIASALVVGTVPIERRGGTASGTPAELLKNGWSLVMFPEGSRSADGQLGRFRLGAAAMAKHFDVPVVPIGIRGAYAAMPRGRNWPVPGRPPLHLRFGPALRAFEDEDPRAYTARIELAVRRLIAEDTGTWWASLQQENPAPRVAGPRWLRVWSATEPVDEPPRRAWN